MDTAELFRKSTVTVFASLNGVRLNSGYTDDILTEAPMQSDFIGKLPPFTATAQIAPGMKIVVHLIPITHPQRLPRQPLHPNRHRHPHANLKIEPPNRYNPFIMSTTY